MAPVATNLTIKITPKDQARLDHIQELTGAASRSEVIRRATEIMAHIRAAEREGQELLIQAADGTRTKLVLL